MTKPAVPPPARDHVVEIDAMDVAEWESGQSTPQASDANLAELVRKSAAPPEPAARAQTVPRERGRTQIGAPAIPQPPSRARTEPPGPPPKSARPRTSVGGSPALPARAAQVPDIPAGPIVEPRRSPAPMTSKGIDFSLPVTATSPGMPVEPAIKARARTPAGGGVDFSLPVTATSDTGERSVTTTGEISGLPVDPARVPPLASSRTGFSMPAVEISARPQSEPPRPRTAARGASDPGPTAAATSESGARPPELTLVPLTPVASPFAEPSRVGPGHQASPAGGAEPNTAWPPRPIPVDPSVHPARIAAPGPSLQLPLPPAPPPAREDAGGTARLQVLTRRRLWWLGGGIAAVSLGAIVAAALIPDPEALPAEANGARAAVQIAGPSRKPPEPPVDRAAADLRERVRLARNAAASAGPMTAPAAAGAVDRRPAPAASAGDASTQLRSSDPEAAAAPRPGHPGKKPPSRRLIVDYTARPDEPPPPSLVAQSEEDPAIGKARTAYTTGNQRLFVGDLDGAIGAYHQALELYPGYVGGYRGLGLAYEELGDTANALAALRAYVAAVPGARDIALIKKRIAHLQRR